MTRVHLVRHGEVHNPDNVVYGRLPGFGLSSRGQQQASDAAAALLERIDGPLLIVSSPLERAVQTADIIHRICAEQHPLPPLSHDVRLQEAGSWMQGLPRQLAPLRYLRARLDSHARSLDEPLEAVASRMRAAIVERAALGAPLEVVLVSHQLPIGMARVAFERGLGEPEAGLLVRRAPWLFVGQRCDYASVTTLTLTGMRAQQIDYWKPAD